MPGLYKRKRPTLNSSSTRSSATGTTTNDGSAEVDISVWHSTAINTTEGEEGGSRRSTPHSDGEEEEDILSLSPVKRLTLAPGVVHPTPGGGDSSGEGRRKPETATTNSASSSPPGPSSLSVIQTPSAAVNLVLREEEGTGNAELFEEMDVDEEKSPPRGGSGRGTGLPVERKAEPEAVASFPRPAAGVGVSVGSRNQILDKSVHFSQRYGPVAIHPPSGHGFFASTIHQCGFVLTIPKNHLFNDVISFRTQLDNWMETNTNENSRIDDGATKFLKAMKKYFSVKDNLIHSCTTTLNDRECIQPSLLACMLGVARLQEALLQVIFPALVEASYSTGHEEMDFVGTVVNQMKWLPRLENGMKFAKDLLTIFETASDEAKKPMIRLLPEIFMPEFHLFLVPQLMEFFDIGTRLNVMMLDCFSCLVVPEQESIRIRSSAVEAMKNADLRDVPAYVSFMFRVGCPMQQLEEGIREMREKLEIKPRERIPQEDIYMVEILERIRFFVSVNPAIAKIWLSQINDDFEFEIDLPTLDMLMLLIFAETSNKGALSMLTTVFSRPNLAIALFDKMMVNNNQILHEIFPTIARFLDSILRQKASKCHDAAAEITKTLFVGLGPVLSQHLTSNLIGVLINGHSTCRDAVLKIFTSIAETDPPKLLYFHSYLMGALVYVIKYPPRQMQALMNVLAILAQMPKDFNKEENSFTAEFMILLRKQITHTSLRTKCFGVLGTIAAVKQLAINSNETNDAKIDGLLALAWSSIENDDEACSIFFDEMINCVEFLPKEICVQFRDILKMQFERLWTVDQASDSILLASGRGQSELDLVPSFDGNKELSAEGDEVQSIIVLEPHALQMSPLVVPSLLRVIAELEKVSEDGKLEGIHSMIGCPVLFPNFPKYFEQMNLGGLSYNQRSHLGQYLVLTLNYFRECVSAFVESESPELRVKVWMRLGNIVTLQKSLVKHYESLPNLPSAYGTDTNMNMTDGPSSSSAPGFSGALLQGRGKSTAAGKKTVRKPKKVPKKKGQKGGKRKKKDEDEDEDKSEEEEEQEHDADGGSDELDNPALNITRLPMNKETMDLEEKIQPKFLSSYIRHLDSRVFSVLISYPLKPLHDPVDYSEILRNLSNATQCSATMRRIEQFSPETLTLLLSEMRRQVKDKNCALKLLSVDNLLASLCRHIDSIDNFYRESSQLDEDSDAFYPLHSPPLDSAFRLLLKVLNLYFETVAKTEKHSRKETVKGVISTIYAHIHNKPTAFREEEDAEEQGMLAQVAKYLRNFFTFVGEEDYDTALEHVKLMKTFHDLLSHPEPMKDVMATAIDGYLKRDWKLPSSAITSLLKTWFSVTPSQMSVVNQIACELFETESDASLCATGIVIPNNSVYKPCNKINFPTWYSTMFAGLAQHFLILGRKKGGQGFEDVIQQWKDGNVLFLTLVDVASKLRKSPILIPLLKFSRLYIQAFVNSGVALLPQLWKQDFREGQKFIKQLQKSTRKIQWICEHCKTKKDTLLLRNVPMLKKTLETVIFKVREVLGSEGIATGFNIGSLKLKDIDGMEIDSQPFNDSSDEDEEEQETDYTQTQDKVASHRMDVDDEDTDEIDPDEEESVDDEGESLDDSDS